MALIKFELKENHIKLLKHLKWSLDTNFIVSKGNDNEEYGNSPFGGDDLIEDMNIIINGKRDNFDPLNDEILGIDLSDDEKNELMEAQDSKEDVSKILTRMIGAEIVLVQGGYKVVAADFEFGAALLVFGQAVLLKTGQCCMLRDGTGADKQVLCQALNDRHHMLWHHQPAQPPAGHVEVFGKAVHADDVVVDRQGRLPPLGFIAQAQVNFIHDGEAATFAHELVDAPQFCGLDRGARWV